MKRILPLLLLLAACSEPDRCAADDLSLGMSESDVETICGKPRSKSYRVLEISAERSERREVWWYGHGFRHSVVFTNGRVARLVWVDQNP